MRAQRRPVFAGILRDERPACVNGVFARYAYFQKFAGRFSYAKIPVISAARAAGGIGDNRDFSARRSGDNGIVSREIGGNVRSGQMRGAERQKCGKCEYLFHVLCYTQMGADFSQIRPHALFLQTH